LQTPDTGCSQQSLDYLSFFAHWQWKSHGQSQQSTCQAVFLSGWYQLFAGLIVPFENAEGFGHDFKRCRGSLMLDADE
jgi:hypothetical protein